MAKIVLGNQTTHEVDSVAQMITLNLPKNTYVRTRSYDGNYLSNKSVVSGGSLYWITTITDYRVFLGSPTWTPDGVIDVTLDNSNVAVNLTRGKIESVAYLKTLFLADGVVVETMSYYDDWVNGSAEIRGGAKYQILTLAKWQALTGLTTPDGYGDHLLPNGNVAKIMHDKKLNFNQLGVTNQTGFQAALSFSNLFDVEFTGSLSFTLTSRIDLPQRFKIKSPKNSIVITASASYFSGSEAFMIYGAAATNITDSYIEGVRVVGGLPSLSVDGIDRYGIAIYGCVNTSVKNCSANGLERGIIIRDGATGGEISHCDAFDCWDQGIGYIGTSSSPIVGVSLHHNSADMTVVSDTVSGIRTEEVYNSSIYENKGHSCNVGLRIENSCDNSIYNNKMWENYSVGGQLYNQSHRNSVYANHFWDNNVANFNDVSLTPDNKGNSNTRLSGLELQNGCNNNNIYGNMCYQTTGGIGHQKYGIGVNIRNLTASDARDAFNLIFGNQCFNNELNSVEDRGFANNVFGNTDNNFFQTIVRNA